MKKISPLLAIIILIFYSSAGYCQGNADVEMADLLRRDGKIYTVVFCLAVILTGMILFLIRIDRKVFRLEKQIQQKE